MAEREPTTAEKAMQEMMKTVLRPLVEEMLTNTFDVYAAVNQNQEEMIRRVVLEMMHRERAREEREDYSRSTRAPRPEEWESLKKEQGRIQQKWKL